MKNPIRSATAAALALACLALGPAAAQEADPEAAPEEPTAAATTTMLRMLDGGILWGGIEEHTAEGLLFRRLDNGGLVRLPWRLLDPALSEDLQLRYGYIDEQGEELMVEADRLVILDPTSPTGETEIIGLIINRTEENLYVKCGGNIIPVPKMRIQGAATKVQIPALDVYTADELYAAEALRMDPTSAADHVEVAGFCERILDFRKALLHYQVARELGCEELEIDIDAVIARAEVKAENQAQIDALHEIDSLRARGNYDKALTRCEAFPEVFPDSPFTMEVLKRQDRVERAREEAMRELVATSWHRHTTKLSREAARSMTIDQAIDYAEETMREEVIEKVHGDLAKRIPSAEPDDVMRLWPDRKRSRWRTASYGLGTWLLGDAKARAGGQEEEQAEPTSEKDAQRQALEEKIKRYLQNQKLARQSRGASEEEGDQREKFWATFPYNAKHLWILAYYAENSGDMEVRDRIKFQPCPTCAGKGVREVLYTGGARTGSRSSELQIVECPPCHHVGIIRRIQYR